jgi:hypothetical protein
VRKALSISLSAALMITIPGAAAQAGQPPRPGLTVVADGLDVPRGLVYDARNDRVLVAEAGLGGPAANHGGTCATSNGGVLCYGPSAAVLQYSERSRSTRRIITGLPSLSTYDEAGTTRFGVLGLHDLGLGGNGQLRAIFGLSGAAAFRAELGRDASGLGHLVKFHGDRPVKVADLVAYEERRNPHPFMIDSNLFGMAAVGDSSVVVDAAGNDVLLIEPDGDLRLLAVMADRAPAADPASMIESVPTSVVKGPDGAFYIGELTGFPYYKGEAKVWRLVPGRAPTVYASGFTNIVDLTFDDRGRLVVLEMAKEGMYSGNPGHNGDTTTGRLVRVERDGSHTDLATTGLEHPGGVAYAGNGVYYLTNRSTSVGGTGQLLRLQTR